MERKKNNLFLVLGGIFITNALLAQLLGVKIFSLETALGLSAAQIPLIGDFVLDFNLTAGVLIWPVVFITTDIINEYFGKAGVRKITLLTVGLIVYAFVIIYTVTELPAAQFWIDLYIPFDIDYAYNTVFLQGMGIIIASLIAFLVGQFLDVFIFQRLRKYTGAKMIWLRATGSTLISQFIDSFMVLIIAFYFLGPWSLEQVIAVGIINYIYKFIVAIVLTPALYGAHYLIDKYLGKEAAQQITEEAAAKSKSFL